MEYLNHTLTITGSEIYYTDEGAKFEVMMDWEDELMSASAAYVCQNGGDILEIGFGMGISANYIQSHSINSHTICEVHPQIILNAQSWASDKPNVTIITSSWYDVKDDLSTYDGLFYDTYGDDNMIHFSSSLASLLKTGGVATWWNNEYTSSNFYNIPNVTYDTYNVSPPENGYFTNSIYYLPKCQH